MNPSIKDAKKCPKCGSGNLEMEKTLYGNTTCMNCHYKGKHQEFQNNANHRFKEEITHDEMRTQTSAWTREARPKMMAYIDQQESKSRKNDGYRKLAELYRQLFMLHTSAKPDGRTFDKVIDMISKQRSQLGLPEDIDLSIL